MEKRTRKPNGHWTPKTLLQDARKYPAKKEWRANSSGAYTIAYRVPALFAQCTAHMKCALNNRLSHEEFLARLAKTNPNTLALSKYIIQGERIKCQCKTCKHEWLGYPNNLLRGASCRLCATKRTKDGLRKDEKTFLKELLEVLPSIKTTSPYLGAKQPIHCSCLSCKHDFETRPTNLLAGHGCPHCQFGGFKMDSKDAVFYEIAFQLNKITYFGFGITHDKKRRIRVHHHNIGEAGGKVLSTKLYSFKDAQECAALEYSIKQQFNTNGNVDISGFKTECIAPEDIRSYRRFVKPQLGYL